MIDWGDAVDRLEEEHEDRVDSLGASASGRYIHSLLEREYGDVPGLSFEEEVSGGRADCIGEDYVYEFKTKNWFNMGEAPLEDDMRQLQRYLNSSDVDVEQGQLIYINRDDFGQVRQFVFEPEYNTDFISDGGLPDFSEYSVYEVKDL